MKRATATNRNREIKSKIFLIFVESEGTVGSTRISTTRVTTIVAD